MYRDPALNHDGESLHADHSQARAHGGTKADRLLHGTCNRARGEGSRDHLRPTLTGEAIGAAESNYEALGVRVMAWP